MNISVIICTYNREKYIYAALKSIAEQDYAVDNYEIVLVNNNSTDRTEQICNNFQTAFPEITFRYFIEENQGLSYARNRGVKESHGDILVFVDDDATVFKDYLQSIDHFFAKHPDILVCGGPIVPMYESGKPAWMSHFTNQLIGGALDEGKKTKPFRYGRYPGGGNSALRRKVFEQYGLYNVELGRKGNSLTGAEEKDLYNRLQRDCQPIYYLPQMGIYHHIPDQKLTNEYFNRLTYSIGKSEYIRTTNVSRTVYLKRLFSEAIKWGASILLFIWHTGSLNYSKGIKLLQFRKNVSKGLLGLDE